VVAAERKRLRISQRLLKFAGEFVLSHGSTGERFWDATEMGPSPGRSSQ
jgi:hypothetical protein